MDEIISGNQTNLFFDGLLIHSQNIAEYQTEVAKVLMGISSNEFSETTLTKRLSLLSKLSQVIEEHFNRELGPSMHTMGDYLRSLNLSLRSESNLQKANLNRVQTRIQELHEEIQSLPIEVDNFVKSTSGMVNRAVDGPYGSRKALSPMERSIRSIFAKRYYGSQISKLFDFAALYFVYGDTQNEIASNLQVSQGTVSNMHKSFLETFKEASYTAIIFDQIEAEYPGINSQNPEEAPQDPFQTTKPFNLLVNADLKSLYEEDSLPDADLSITVIPKNAGGGQGNIDHYLTFMFDLIPVGFSYADLSSSANHKKILDEVKPDHDYRDHNLKTNGRKNLDSLVIRDNFVYLTILIWEDLHLSIHPSVNQNIKKWFDQTEGISPEEFQDDLFLTSLNDLLPAVPSLLKFQETDLGAIAAWLKRNSGDSDTFYFNEFRSVEKLLFDIYHI